jgi:hypothetical protein
MLIPLFSFFACYFGVEGKGVHLWWAFGAKLVRLLYLPYLLVLLETKEIVHFTYVVPKYHRFVTCEHPPQHTTQS